MRAARAASRRELLKSKRARNTEMLPGVNEEDTRERSTRPQASHLREENLSLRRELEELQEQLATYQSSMDLLDGEIETIHRDHRQEIEQYQQHLREMMEERNQMQEANQQWERRYQDLYHSFQDAVEEEADKMVKEAAQTLILSPEHAPALLSDVVKSLEFQMKQTDDQRTAEVLAVLRQAQYKAELLAQEVARERHELANERENLRILRDEVSQQAKQRYRTEQLRLRSRWTAGLTLVTLSMLVLLVVLALILDGLGFPLSIDLFLPLLACLGLTYLFAYLHTTGRLNIQVKGQPAKSKNAKPAAKKAVAKK
jgi:chromosome segregation ATPase